MYLDLDHDDRHDPGEPVSVTDAAGEYVFTNLLPGTYDVLTVPVAGWQQTFPLPNNNNDHYIDFDANDHVFDVERNLLYLTGLGTVLRYDVGSKSYLTPYTIGSTAILGADISPDGQFLYVAGGTNAAAFHKIDLDTGVITAIPYTPTAPTSSPWDVGIASNGYAFLSTQYSGGSSDPLLRLDLSNDSISNEPGQATYTKRNIWTSPTNELLVMASDVFSARIYDTATDDFTTFSGLATKNAVAISPENQLIASATYSTLFVYDAATQNSVFTTGDYDLNGGVTFDPVRDLMYVGNSSTNRVVAYDTKTWTVQFEFTGFLHGVQRYLDYSEGLISISPDGRLLFVSTGDAIQGVRLTPRHRVELGNGEVASGLDFGEQSTTDYLSIEFSAASISEHGGTATSVGTVRRNTADLTDSLVVHLFNPDQSEISIPSSVTILAGQATADFDIDAVDDDLLDGPQGVTIAATAAGLHAGQGTVTVNDHEQLAISVAPNSFSETAGTGAGIGTVQRNNTDIDQALTVYLQSADESKVRVPDAVTIPAGQASAAFSVQAVDDLLADGDHVVELAATASGYVDGTSEVTVENNDLAMPVITAPAGTTSDATPTFTWNAVSGATNYELWVYHVNSGTHKIVYENGITGTSFTPATPLPGGKYIFWIRAHATGMISLWATGEFVIGTTLTAPTLTSPSGNTTDTTPTFNWDAVAGATTYELSVYSITTNTHHIIHKPAVSTNTYTPAAGEALAAGRYRFWARARDASGNLGPWSAAMDFSIGAVPEVPTVTGPTGTTADTTPTFTWTDEGADYYVLWVTNSSTGQRVIYQTNLTTNSFTPSTPLASGPHVFWVQAWGAGSSKGWTAATTFVVGTVLAPPTVTGPTGNTFDPTPTFSWNAVSGAVKYELSVYSRTTNAHNVIHETALTGTSFTPATALPSGRYQFWLRTQSADGLWGDWSSGTDFSVNIPTIPVLLGPTGDITDTTPTFSWEAATGAVRYELWVYDQTTDTQKVIHRTDITATSYTSGTALVAGHTYMFWVRGFNEDDLDGEWSGLLQFTIL